MLPGGPRLLAWPSGPSAPLPIRRVGWPRSHGSVKRAREPKPGSPGTCSGIRRGVTVYPPGGGGCGLGWAAAPGRKCGCSWSHGACPAQRALPQGRRQEDPAPSPSWAQGTDTPGSQGHHACLYLAGGTAAHPGAHTEGSGWRPSVFCPQPLPEANVHKQGKDPGPEPWAFAGAATCPATPWPSLCVQRGDPGSCRAPISVLAAEGAARTWGMRKGGGVPDSPQTAGGALLRHSTRVGIQARVWGTVGSRGQGAQVGLVRVGWPHGAWAGEPGRIQMASRFLASMLKVGGSGLWGSLRSNPRAPLWGSPSVWTPGLIGKRESKSNAASRLLPVTLNPTEIGPRADGQLLSEKVRSISLTAGTAGEATALGFGVPGHRACATHPRCRPCILCCLGGPRPAPGLATSPPRGWGELPSCGCSGMCWAR